MVMKTRVMAEAWISVSRSGHWTRLSSAQQEAKNPSTPPRWRRSAGACVLGARRFSESLARCFRSRSSWRRARRLILSAGAASAAGSAVRGRRGLHGRLGVAGPALELLEVDPALGELGLGYVGGLGDLGVVLGVRLLVALGLDLSRLLLGLASLLGLALCTRLRHVRRSAGFLVRGVMTTPAAVLAHLDPVRRVSPRLVGLVIAPLAVLAGEGYGDSYVSASHLLS